MAARTPWAAAVLGAGFFVFTLCRFFPNASGRLGYDYGLFMPWFTAGRFWQAVNGPLVPPEYLPSFCGGVPFLFNPQSVYWSLPQALMSVLPPMASLLASWTLLGLAGALGMYLLTRRVFETSRPAALLAATIFLLNGFYISRMVIGHVTFHGTMLLPLIALLLFARPGPRIAATIARAIAAGLLLAYQFGSGGTNTILPMGLALAMLGVLLALGGRWHRGIVTVALAACLLCLALSAYRLIPALAYAGNVVRPVSLRMTGSIAALVGGAGVSLFAPQVLAFLPADTLVLDRVEFEYGVGIVPLLALGWGLCAAVRRGHLRAALRWRGAWLAPVAVLLLAIPILVNWDALGLRWLVLHLPVLKMMSVMLRFWFAYVPLLCVLTAVLLDYLIADPARRALWASGAMVLTIAQAAATDMRYYERQEYDPAPLLAAHAGLAAGGAVPKVTHVADPWATDGRHASARNDAVAKGGSAYPCYEPMFGYRMEVFRQGRLAAGAVLEERGGMLNLKNPSCYTFPEENGCRPGDEFTAAQRPEAEAFAGYRPFAHARPLSLTIAGWLSFCALWASLAALALTGVGAAYEKALRRRAPKGFVTPSDSAAQRSETTLSETRGSLRPV